MEKEQNLDLFFKDLFDLIRIQSVSSDSSRKGDMVRCAEKWAEILLRAGVDKAELMPTAGNPIVYAEKIVDSSGTKVACGLSTKLMWYLVPKIKVTTWGAVETLGH